MNDYLEKTYLIVLWYVSAMILSLVTREESDVSSVVGVSPGENTGSIRRCLSEG